MAEFVVKLLADGQLPATKTTLYTAPVGKNALIRSIMCVTNDSVDRTVNVYVKRTTSRRIIPKDTIAEPNRSIELDLDLMLSPGDVIEGECSVATTVDYVIFGLEQE